MIIHEEHLTLMHNVLALRTPTIQSSVWRKKQIMKFTSENRTVGYKLIKKKEIYIF